MFFEDRPPPKTLCFTKKPSSREIVGNTGHGDGICPSNSTHSAHVMLGQTARKKNRASVMRNQMVPQKLAADVGAIGVVVYFLSSISADTYLDLFFSCWSTFLGCTVGSEHEPTLRGRSILFRIQIYLGRGFSGTNPAMSILIGSRIADSNCIDAVSFSSARTFLRGPFILVSETRSACCGM